MVAVSEIFRDTSPFVEGISIDEAFLVVGGLCRLSDTPTESAALSETAVVALTGKAVGRHLFALAHNLDP